MTKAEVNRKQLQLKPGELIEVNGNSLGIGLYTDFIPGSVIVIDSIKYRVENENGKLVLYTATTNRKRKKRIGIINIKGSEHGR